MYTFHTPNRRLRVSVSVSKPNQHFLSARIDGSHVRNLGVLFQYVMLSNADCIDPDRFLKAGFAKLFQGIVKVASDLEFSAIEQNRDVVAWPFFFVIAASGCTPSIRQTPVRGIALQVDDTQWTLDWVRSATLYFYQSSVVCRRQRLILIHVFFSLELMRCYMQGPEE